MEEDRDYYDEIMRIMQVATHAFVGSDIPKSKIPPVLADYITLSIIGMSDEEHELAEEAIKAIQERMSD